MMKIEIRNDKAVVSGYVNAVGRDSRPITDKDGKLFIEQIEPGAFRASLERSENVDLLLNHNKSKVYASTKDGSLKLTEDSIGLRAEAVLTDAEMIRKARSGEFRGWSFGMYVGDSAMEERAEGIPRRHVKSLNMFEVSLIDKSRIPCYVGTSVECRSDGEILAELRYSEEEPEIIEEERSEPEPVDYSAVDDVISELRYGAVDNVIAELRYNPYHDPSNGRFTSGGGSGGGGVLVVEKGQKGKGVYVVPSEEFEKNKAPVSEKIIINGVEKEVFSTAPEGFFRDENASSGINGIDLYSNRKSRFGGERKTVLVKNEYFKNESAQSLADKAMARSKQFKEHNDYVRLHRYDRPQQQSTTSKRYQNSLAKKVSAFVSRSFDPIDSKIEELRSSDPADGG